MKVKKHLNLLIQIRNLVFNRSKWCLLPTSQTWKVRRTSNKEVERIGHKVHPFVKNLGKSESRIWQPRVRRETRWVRPAGMWTESQSSQRQSASSLRWASTTEAALARAPLLTTLHHAKLHDERKFLFWILFCEILFIVFYQVFFLPVFCCIFSAHIFFFMLSL